MKNSMQKFEKWINIFVAICIVTAVVILIIDLTVPISEHTRHIFHTIDSFLFAIFISHLCFSFFLAYDKKKFFRQNWLLILSYMPIMSMFGIARYKKAAEALRIFNHRHELAALEGMGMAGIVAQTSKIENVVRGMKSMVHVGYTDWGVIHGKKVIVNKFVSPCADKQVVKGIIQGMDFFLKKKVDTKPMFVYNSWKRPHFEEQEFNWYVKRDAEDYVQKMSDKIDRKGMNIFITHEALQFDSSLTDFSAHRKKSRESSYYVFSTAGLDEFSDKYPYEIDVQKEQRGFIIGYNTMAKRFHYNFLKSKCSEQHCIHNCVNKDNLDLLSFMYFMNRRKPICDVHAV
jgi:ion transport protein